MRLTFSNIRSAIDVLRWRLPGALAFLKATDASVSIHHREGRGDWVTVTYGFDDRKACGNAYRACERLYEFDREQRVPWWPPSYRPEITSGMSEDGIG